MAAQQHDTTIWGTFLPRSAVQKSPKGNLDNPPNLCEPLHSGHRPHVAAVFLVTIGNDWSWPMGGSFAG